MLIPFNSQTLSTQLWATTNGEALDFTAAAPYAAMLVLLGAVPVALLVRNALRSADPTRADSARGAPVRVDRSWPSGGRSRGRSMTTSIR
jgi:ABC-type Fe3+ transport system permease subunit